MALAHRMLITTTSSLDGWNVVEYRGPVSAQIVIGTGVFADFLLGWTDLFGARSRSYQKKLDLIDNEVIELITEKAVRAGGDAVLGLRVDHDEISGAGKSMLMVTASGTVARIRKAAAADGQGLAPAATISSFELRTMLRRQEIITLAQRGDLAWDERDWRFIIDEGVFEVVEHCLDHADARLAAYPYAELEVRARIEELFDAMPTDICKAHLYGCCGRGPVLYEEAVKAIRRAEAFDPDLIMTILGGEDALASRRVVAMAAADQPYYGPEDIPRLEVLRDAIAAAFPERPTKEVGTAFRKRQVWVCECTKEVEADRCPRCGKSRWGFEEGLTDPPAVIAFLYRRINALRGQMEARNDVSMPEDVAPEVR